MAKATNNSTLEESKEETHITTMGDKLENTISNDSNKEVYFFNIHSLKEAYQKVIFINTHLAFEYKTLKKDFTNSCKEIKYM